MVAPLEKKGAPPAETKRELASPAAVAEIAEVPFPRSTPLVVRVVAPVPPLETVRAFPKLRVFTLRVEANVDEAVALSPVKVENPPKVAPPVNVDVPVFVMLRTPLERIFPPVIVRPAEEARPAEDIPPANVEVAVEEELRFPVKERSPATFTPDWNVEDPACIEVEEAWKRPEEINPLTNVEEAEAIKPPDELMVNNVEVPVPEFCF